MKDQYFADIYDYRKYGLLRTLVGDNSLTTTICWMLTECDGGTDGKYINYLANPDKWRNYDPFLFDSLVSCMTDPTNRAVSWAKACHLIPSAVYFSRILTDSALEREKYFEEFEKIAAGSDLIFFDPDNGLEIKSVPYGRKGSRKYLYWWELIKTYNNGHSVLVYQHFNRIKRQTFSGQIIDSLCARLHAPELVSFTTANVLFLLLVQPRHQSLLAERCARVTAVWGSQIEVHKHRCV